MTGHNCPQPSPLDPSDQNLDQDLLLRKQAFLKANQGHHYDAIALFDLLIQRHPTTASFYNNRGLLHFQTGDLLDALDDYDRAIALNPKLSQAFNNRANCHVSLGNLEAAIADYDAALDLNPMDLNAWINQGMTFRDMDLFNRAIENFDIALQLNELVEPERMEPGRFADSRTHLAGHIYTQRGRTHHIAGYWNWAIADYRRALQLLPQKSTASTRKFYRLRTSIKGWLQELLGSTADWGCAG
jgi:tetratricopeptide (TPR) repeat protein